MKKDETRRRSSSSPKRVRKEINKSNFTMLDLRAVLEEDRKEEEARKEQERIEAEKQAEELRRKKLEMEALNEKRRRETEALKAQNARKRKEQEALNAKRKAEQAALNAKRQAEQAKRRAEQAARQARQKAALQMELATGDTSSKPETASFSDSVSMVNANSANTVFNKTVSSSRNFSSVNSAARKIRNENSTKKAAPRAELKGMDEFYAKLEAAKIREAEEARIREIRKAKQKEEERRLEEEAIAARIREEEARKIREAEEERIRALELAKLREDEEARRRAEEAARAREEAERMRAIEARKRREAEAERIREKEIAKLREAEAERFRQESEAELRAELLKLKTQEEHGSSIEQLLEEQASRFQEEAAVLHAEEMERKAREEAEETERFLTQEVEEKEPDLLEDFSFEEEVEKTATEAEDADVIEINLVGENQDETEDAEDSHDTEDTDGIENKETDLVTETAPVATETSDDETVSYIDRPFNRKKFDAMLGKILSLFMILCMICNILIKDQKTSEIENRELKQMPKLTAATLADGSFTGSFESWQSDQFVGRNLFRNLQIFLRWLGGDREENGVYLGKKGQLLEAVVSPEEGLLQENISAMNAFASQYPDKSYAVMMVPEAGTILSESYPAFAEKSNQKETYAQVQGMLSEQYQWVDLIGALEGHSEEKLYYKTDHHWTSLAAKYAYESFCQQKGLEPGSFTAHTVSLNFNGVLSSTSGFCMGEKEAIDVYLPDAGTKVVVTYVDDQRKTTTLYDRSKLETKDQYGVFMGGNYPLIDIRTTVDNDKSLLLFKDSYANSVLPFLATQYSEIVVVDPRYYYGDAQELMNTYSVTDVLFLYSGNTFFADNNIQGVLEIA